MFSGASQNFWIIFPVTMFYRHVSFRVIKINHQKLDKLFKLYYLTYYSFEKAASHYSGYPELRKLVSNAKPRVSAYPDVRTTEKLQATVWGCGG